MTNETFQSLEALLHSLHDELVERRRRLEETSHNLGQDEIEFEERATNAQLVNALERLEDLGEQKLTAVEQALDRLHSGEYQTCASCGGTISSRRLEIIPWTTLCIDCAEEQEGGRRGAEERSSSEEMPLPESLQGLSDGEVSAMVLDAVREDGAVPTDDLSITCHNGELRLAGALPDERQHGRLQQIVYDVLGFEEVEDSIRIDRTAWERRERTAGRKTSSKKEPDSGEGGGIEVIEAIKEGKTITPADDIIPEKKSGKE